MLEQWYGDFERDRVYFCAGELELRFGLAYHLRCNDSSVNPRCAYGVAGHTEQLGNGAYGIGDGVSKTTARVGRNLGFDLDLRARLNLYRAAVVSHLCPRGTV